MRVTFGTLMQAPLIAIQVAVVEEKSEKAKAGFEEDQKNLNEHQGILFLMSNIPNFETCLKF